jgi:thiol-disulfide isomerase/thioredoxin
MLRRDLLALPLAAALPTLALAERPDDFIAPPPPQLIGPTLDGKKFTLEQERGKIVLVSFWATWCPTCRSEMPEMRANYEKWRSKGFNLITVSIDDGMKDIEQYDQLIQQTVPVKQQFPRLWRKQPGLIDNFGYIRGTPTHFLLDKNGLLIKQFVGRTSNKSWDEIAARVMA